jgi:hypothetical protein
MTMKKKFGVAIATVLILGLSTPVQAATPKAGAKCTKAGITATAAGKKFTCIKSGTKLVWNKGVVIKAASKPEVNPVFKPVEPTPTPTPTPTPSSTPTPTPTPTPTVKPWTPPIAPTDWKDVVQQANGIAYWAWKKSAQKIESSSTKLGVMEILISPNGVPDNPVPLVALNLVSRLSANYEEPKKVVMVYAGEKDIEWGQKQIDEFCAGRMCGYDVAGEAKKACNVPVTPCWGGLALRNRSTNIPMIYMTASDWGKTDPGHTSGTLEAHEYFHTVQSTLLANVGWDRVPRWLIEGGATWVQRATVFYADFGKYEVQRNGDNSDSLSRNKRSADWIEKFLDPDYTTGWDKWNGNEYDRWAVYDVGSLASEVMVSIGGPDKFMDLYKVTGTGKSFAQAFESIYGISWREGVKIIANAIVAQQK